METYLLRKECRSCQNTYHTVEVSEEYFQTRLMWSRDVTLEVYSDCEVLTTFGCCRDCEKEYYESLAD